MMQTTACQVFEGGVFTRAVTLARLDANRQPHRDDAAAH